MNPEVRDSLVKIARVLAEQEQLTATVSHSAKGALVAGAGVFVGGILAGPIGMAFGGTITSIVVALSSQGKFKSVVAIIDEMNSTQKEHLAEQVQRALGNIKPEDCIKIATMCLSVASKEAILVELGIFLRKELQMQLANR